MNQPSAAACETFCRVLVLISGNGSNLQALIDRSQKPQSQYRIIGVVSNRPGAFGLQRAERAGIPAIALDHRQFSSREDFDASLTVRIDELRPDLVVLAGFMRILSPVFVQHYAGRLLNIHPSLLPAYKGTNTHQRVLEAGDAWHGVSVHFVTEELDGGPVVLHSVISVLPDDTKESLAARVAIEEHKIYPEAVRWFAQGRLTVQHTNTANCRLAQEDLRDSTAINRDSKQSVMLDGALLPQGGISFTDI